jgi:hypothetical protein
MYIIMTWQLETKSEQNVNAKNIHEQVTYTVCNFTYNEWKVLTPNFV